MRILILGGYPLGTNRSGSIVHAQKMAQSLAALADSEVHFITVGKPRKFTEAGVKLHVVSLARSVLSLLCPSASWSVRRLIRKIKPDVLHIMGDRFPYGLLATPLRHEIPVVMSVFSLSSHEFRFNRNLLRLARNLLINFPSMRYLMPRQRDIVVQSRFTHDLVQPITPARLHIVPEGVDYGHLQIYFVEKPSSDGPDIFIAVNFRRLKGVDTLLRALAIVKRQLPGVRLDIAGAGEEEPVLRELVAELGLGANVRFLGFISDESVIFGHYSSCRLVVVPSRWDVEPFATLHGAALGKPVIASHQSNSSLVIDGETGYTFDAEDYEALAGHIVTLLSDEKLRQRLAETAHRKAAEYDWAVLAEHVMEVYRAAAQGL